MRRVMMFLTAVLLVVQFASAGQIDVYLPDLNVTPSETRCNLPIIARLQGGDVYNVGGYVLKVDITGSDGCTFAGPAVQPSSNYLLDESDAWDGGSLANAGRTIEETTDVSIQSYSIDANSGDVARALVNLPVALSGIRVGDTFSFSFDVASSDDTGLWNWAGDFYGGGGMPTIAWHGGSITVVPEPSTFALLCSALLGLLICTWRGRRPRIYRRPIRFAFSKIPGRAASMISRTSS